MKAVLVVDMPDCCANCTLMDDDIAGEYCNAHDDDYIDIPDVTDGKPNWCPLMELPEQWEIELTQESRRNEDESKRIAKNIRSA